MTLRKVGVVGLLIAGILSSIVYGQGAGSKESPNLTALSDADVNALTIKLERSGCFGTCPAYTLTIHGDGTVEYSGKSHVKESGMRDGKVEIVSVKELVAEFAKTKFWEIADDYSETKCTGRLCTDFPTVVTELTVRGQTHRVTHYYGCGSAPKSLFELESSVDKSANSSRWTGDVSKAGPFGTTCR